MFHDTANAIATSVSTRALQTNHAIKMAAMLNFLGAMVSTGVASPRIAIITGIIIMNILFRMFEKNSPHAVNDKFRKLQVLSASA